MKSSQSLCRASFSPPVKTHLVWMSTPGWARAATRDFFNITLRRSRPPPPALLPQERPHLCLYRGIDGERFRRTPSALTFICVAGKEAYDPSGQTRYMEACETLQVVPASYFLRHVKDAELNMMHRGLGPQVLSSDVRKLLSEGEGLELGTGFVLFVFAELFRGEQGKWSFYPNYIFCYYSVFLI